MPSARPEEGVVEQHLVPTVLGEILGVADHLLAVLGDPAVEHGVAELDQGVAEDHRRMRVALLVGVGMVLAVHRHPLPGSGARRHPDDDAAHEGHRGPQRDRFVRQSPVQVHRRDDERDLRRDEPDEKGLEDRGHAAHSSSGDDPPRVRSPRARSPGGHCTRAQRRDPRQDGRVGDDSMRGAFSMSFTPYDRPVRAAFIGLGRIYDLNVRAYLDNPDVEVVALVDPSEERRAERAGRLAGGADLRLRRRAGRQRPGGGRGGGAAPHPAARRGRRRAPRLRLARQPAEADVPTTSPAPGAWSTPPRPTTVCCGSWRTTSSTSPCVKLKDARRRRVRSATSAATT